jgi:hypothetical protein
MKQQLLRLYGYGLPHTIGLQSRPWTSPRLLVDEVVCHPGAQDVPDHVSWRVHHERVACVQGTL